MTRCKRTDDLEVHHIRAGGGNKIGNAIVLCHKCHEANKTFGIPGTTSKAFSVATRKLALEKAGNQCQCKRTGGCH